MRLPNLSRIVPRRQRGAYVVIVASVMMLLVMSVALAVDTGRLFLEQRHMQRVADLAALEAAGAVALISQASDADLASAAQDSAKRNGHDSEESGRTLITVGGGVCHASEGDGKVRVFFPLGHDDPSVACSDGHEGTLERHAVEVTASHQVRPSLFGSLLGEDEITISATAMAQRSQAEKFAVFSVGSRLLSLDTDSSVLSPLLRGLLGLEADVELLGFNGIADATITLSDLLDVPELGVGSVEELLSAELKLLDLIAQLKAAHHGPEDESELLVLQALDERLRAFISAGNIITVGDLLDIGTERAPLDAEVSAIDLLSTALLIANQENAVELPGLNLSVPGVTNIEAMLEVIEPPQIAIGPAGCLNDIEPDPYCNGEWKTEARTSQVRLGVGADVRIPVIADLGVKLGLVAGGARAGIEGAQPAGEEESHKWDVDVAAYQYPLATKLDLKLDVLNTSLPLLDSDLDGSGIPLLESFVSLLGLDSGLVGGLLSAVGDLLDAVVGGLVEVLKEILGPLASRHEYYKESTDEICVQAYTLLWIKVGEPQCDPASHLPDEVGDGDQSPGWSDNLEAWLEGAELQAGSSPMTPSRKSLEWPEQQKADFLGSTEVALEFRSLLGEIDLKLHLFGASIPTEGLLSPVFAVVQAVTDKVVASLAAGVIDPLLDALGVNINEAEVHVIDIDYHTGPPELL